MTRRNLPELLGHQPPRQEWESQSLSFNATIKLVDETLHRFHQYGFATQNCLGSTPDYAEEIARLRYVIDQTLANTTEGTQKVPYPRQYFDLLGRAAFLEEMAYAPLLLSGAVETTCSEIEKLVDGTYSLNVHILADALEHHSNPEITEEQQGYLRGTINELTAIALLNRDQAFGTLALPSTFAADTVAKTDLFYFHRHNDTPLVTNIQVKTVNRRRNYQKRPANGIIVTAQDMNNTELATSRAIVTELYANPAADQTSDPDYLNESHANFMSIVKQKISNGDAFYSPYEVIHVGLKN